MQAALDPRSRSRLQPRLQPMHSGRPPLRPCTVPAKTSFSPRHTHTHNTHTTHTHTHTHTEPAELVFRSSWPRPAARECPSTEILQMNPKPASMFASSRPSCKTDARC